MTLAYLQWKPGGRGELISIECRRQTKTALHDGCNKVFTSVQFFQSCNLSDGAFHEVKLPAVHVTEN